MKILQFCLPVLIIFTLITFPYLAAAQAAGDAHVFQGFLLNPVDGNTYLAKMYQGWQGNWQFRLPYSADPGDGAYLFLFYLALGHLARWLGLSLILVFHLARLVSAIFLWRTLWRFWQVLGFSGRWLSLVFSLSLLGSGLGWLALLFGGFTSDLWVAETYPFLSAYSNPHFPLSLALILNLMMMANRASLVSQQPKRDMGLLLVSAAILALIAPFGVVIVLVVLGLRLGWLYLDWRSASPHHFLQRPFFSFKQRGNGFNHLSLCIALILAGAAPGMIYELSLATTHPQLSAWHAQNLTPSAPLWDVLVSLSPALWLALWSMVWLLRRNANRAMQTRQNGERGLAKKEQMLAVLGLWLAAGLLLAYLPLGLQRRFLLGLFLPAAGLAVFALQSLAASHPLAARRLGMALLLFSLPTNLVVLLAGRQGVLSKDPLLFLTAAEAQTIGWIADNTVEDAIILASPQTGLFIPARSGRRVLYGHPFETIHAAEEKQIVVALLQQNDAFFTPQAVHEYLQQRGVGYFFWGPRERELAGENEWPFLTPVYHSGDVTLYQVQP